MYHTRCSMLNITLEGGKRVYGKLIDSSLPTCPQEVLAVCKNKDIAEDLRILSNAHRFMFFQVTDAPENDPEFRNKVISINPAMIVTIC